MADITDVSRHYQFGANWFDFAERVDERVMGEAVRGFARLIAPKEIAGKSLLDIGCGSGLHSLAALRLGAQKVAAVDIDPRSVEATRHILTRFAPDDRWTAEVRSVFDLDGMPHYDVVYSWGVLHHTGDMHRAIRIAAEKVAPSGLFCIAVYRKTPMCAAWRVEKRVYTASPEWLRRGIEALYLAAFQFKALLTRRDFNAYVDDYVKNRGMSFITDVRDWLGGYPYESISESETLDLLGSLGFEPVRRFCWRSGIGLLGTGCDEYVFRRIQNNDDGRDRRSLGSVDPKPGSGSEISGGVGHADQGDNVRGTSRACIIARRVANFPHRNSPHVMKVGP